MLKGKGGLEDEGWEGFETLAGIEALAIDFLTASTAAELADDAFVLRFFAPALRLALKFVKAFATFVFGAGFGVGEQEWSAGNL